MMTAAQKIYGFSYGERYYYVKDLFLLPIPTSKDIVEVFINFGRGLEDLKKIEEATNQMKNLEKESKEFEKLKDDLWKEVQGGYTKHVGVFDKALDEICRTFALECVREDWADVPIEGNAYEASKAMKGYNQAKQEIRNKIENIAELADANGAKAIAKEHLKRDYEKIEEASK